MLVIKATCSSDYQHMMSANFSPVGETMSLEATLDLIKNAALYEQRLSELKNQQAKAIEATVNLTKAKDLNAAIENAKRLEQQAKDVQSAALVKAKQITDEAEAKGSQIVSAANESINDIVSQVHNKQGELSALTAQANLLTQQIEDLGEKYNDLVKDVRAKELEKQALHETITEKQRKLKELLNA